MLGRNSHLVPTRSRIPILRSNVPGDFERITQGEFLEIVEPQRLVFTWNVDLPDEPQVEQRVSVGFWSSTRRFSYECAGPMGNRFGVARVQGEVL